MKERREERERRATLFFKNLQSGVPVWLIRLSMWLLVSGQILTSWVVRSSPRSGSLAQQGVCLKILSLCPSASLSFFKRFPIALNETHFSYLSLQGSLWSSYGWPSKLISLCSTTYLCLGYYSYFRPCRPLRNVLPPITLHDLLLSLGIFFSHVSASLHICPNNFIFRASS